MPMVGAVALLQSSEFPFRHVHCDISFRALSGALLTVPPHLLCPGLLTAVPYGNSKRNLGNRKVTDYAARIQKSSGLDPSSNPEDFAKVTACWPSPTRTLLKSTVYGHGYGHDHAHGQG